MEGSGRGGCVTLVWVLPGHRGDRRAEQGRRQRPGGGREPALSSILTFLHCSFTGNVWPLTWPFQEAIIKSSSFKLFISKPIVPLVQTRCSWVPAKPCLSTHSTVQQQQQRPASVLRSRPREGKAVKLRPVFLLGLFGIFLPIRSRGCSRERDAPAETSEPSRQLLL